MIKSQKFSEFEIKHKKLKKKEYNQLINEISSLLVGRFTQHIGGDNTKPLKAKYSLNQKGVQNEE